MVGSNCSEYAPAGGMNLNTTASQTTRGWSLRGARVTLGEATTARLLAACASGALRARARAHACVSMTPAPAWRRAGDIRCFTGTVVLLSEGRLAPGRCHTTQSR
eukprot:COSAG02_NODE_39892_length_411_cov_1.038462_1_plen_104_part_10